MQSYHIYEEIGRGRGSIVYKGRKKKEIRYVAIKSIDKVNKQRVLHEVSILFALKHPNVLRFVNWYETSNHIWVIVEYCTGGDLLSLLRQDRRLPEASARIFMKDIAAGLQYVHSKGFVYGDLKPSNVLVNEFGVLKLCDFALARGVDRASDERFRASLVRDSHRGGYGSETASTNRRGSPYYMAPELFRSNGVHSFASDFWAFGCLLYELIAGSPPFYAQTIQGLVRKILETQLPEPALPVAAASPACSDLIRRCLERDPRKRITWPEMRVHSFWIADSLQSTGPAFPDLPIPFQPLFEEFATAASASEELQQGADKEGLQRVYSKSESLSGSQRVSSVRKSNDFERRETMATEPALARLSEDVKRLSVSVEPQDLLDDHGERKDEEEEEAESEDYESDYDDFDEDVEDEVVDLSAEAERAGSASTPSGKNDVAGESQPPSRVSPLLRINVAEGQDHKESVDRYDEDFMKMSDEFRMSPRSEHLSQQRPQEPEQPTSLMRRHLSESPQGYSDDCLDEDRGRCDRGDENIDEIVEEVVVASPKSGSAARRSVHLLVESRDGSRRGSPVAATSPAKLQSPTRAGAAAARSSQDVDQLSTRWSLTRIKNGIDTASAFSASDRSKMRERLFSLLMHDPEVVVRPLDGNQSIEKIATPRFRFDESTSAMSLLSSTGTYSSSSLPFRALRVASILGMDTVALEAFLSNVYSSIMATLSEQSRGSAQSSSALSSADVQFRTVFVYLLTICTDSRVANIVINSSLLGVLVRLVKQVKTNDAKRLVLRVLSTLIRHTTYIDPSQDSSGLIQVVSETLRDKSAQIRRRAMCTLGEMLFYVATQQDDHLGSMGLVSLAEGHRSRSPSPSSTKTSRNTKDAGSATRTRTDGVQGFSGSARDADERRHGSSFDGGPKGPFWRVPAFTLQMVLRSLRSAEDAGVKHYACCAIQNICTQCPHYVKHWFGAAKWVMAVYGVFSSCKDRALRVLAATTLWSLVLHQHASVLQKFVEKVGLSVVLSAISDRSLDVSQAFLNILCLAIHQGLPRLRSSLKKDYRWLTRLMRLFTGVSHATVRGDSARDGGAHSAGRDSPSIPGAGLASGGSSSARVFRHHHPTSAAVASKGKKVLKGKILLVLAFLTTLDHWFVVNVCNSFPVLAVVDRLHGMGKEPVASSDRRHANGDGGNKLSGGAILGSSGENNAISVSLKYLFDVVDCFVEWLPAQLVPLTLGITRHLVAVSGRSRAPTHTARQLGELLILGPLFRHTITSSSLCTELLKRGFLDHMAVHVWLLSQCKLDVPGLLEYRRVVLHVIEALIVELDGSGAEGRRVGVHGRRSGTMTPTSELKEAENLRLGVIVEQVYPAMLLLLKSATHSPSLGSSTGSTGPVVVSGRASASAWASHMLFSTLKSLSDVTLFLLRSSLFSDSCGDSRGVDALDCSHEQNHLRLQLENMFCGVLFPQLVRVLDRKHGVDPTPQYALKILSAISRTCPALVHSIHGAGVTPFVMSAFVGGHHINNIHNVRIIESLINAGMRGTLERGQTEVTMVHFLRLGVVKSIVGVLFHAAANSLSEFYEPLLGMITTVCNYLVQEGCSMSPKSKAKSPGGNTAAAIVESLRCGRFFVWDGTPSKETFDVVNPNVTESVSWLQEEWGVLPLLVEFMRLPASISGTLAPASSKPSLGGNMNLAAKAAASFALLVRLFPVRVCMYFVQPCNSGTINVLVESLYATSAADRGASDLDGGDLSSMLALQVQLLTSLTVMFGSRSRLAVQKAVGPNSMPVVADLFGMVAGKEHFKRVLSNLKTQDSSSGGDTEATAMCRDLASKLLSDLTTEEHVDKKSV